MITGIKNIYLYTGLTPTGGDASAKAVEWMDANNIKYTNLWYGDKAQHQSVFDALNTWGIGTFDDFPFVTYEEQHDDADPTVQALLGLDAITTSNLVELQALSNI